MTPSDAPETEASRTTEEPTEPTPVVFVIGAGVVGTALAGGLVRAGVPVAGVHGRKTELSEAAGGISGVLATTGEYPDILAQSDAIIISVRDERISEVATRLVKEKRLRPEQVLLHTSGAHAAADVLAPAAGRVRGLGTLHPLLSFASAEAATRGLAGAAFGIEGDAAACAVASRLVRAVGGRPLHLEAAGMPLYHAGAVVASNYVVAMADIARSMLIEAGVPADEALPALVRLMSSAVQNLEAVGLPAAMTGPMVRGDVQSVERHLGTLEARRSPALDIYRRLGREALRIARQKAALEPNVVARLGDLLGASGDPPSAPHKASPKAAPKKKPTGRK